MSQPPFASPGSTSSNGDNRTHNDQGLSYGTGADGFRTQPSGTDVLTQSEGAGSSTDTQGSQSPPPSRPRVRPKRCYSIDAIRSPTADRPADPDVPQQSQLPSLQEGEAFSPVQTTAPQRRESNPSTPAVSRRRPSLLSSAMASQDGAGATPTRSRSHSVGVNMPPRRQFIQPRPVAEIISEDHARQRSSSTASENRRSSLSAIDITVPEAHDSAIADHNGALHDDVVGMLDCVDPEVGTVNHLQNVTNSIMFPHFPALWSRRPNLTLNSDAEDYSVIPELRDDSREDSDTLPEPVTAKKGGRSRASTLTRYIPGMKEKEEVRPSRPPLTSRVTAPANIPLADLSDKKETFDDELSESAEDISQEHELDQHVRKVLERKQKIRRGLRGLWAYLKTPMGAITAIYGFLVAFWGAAIVLFLLGWIPTSSKDTKDKWVEISSQVENGLFTVTGVGLIPWRVVDTYRMSIIYTLKQKIRRRRKELGLPPPKNPDDLVEQYESDDDLLSEEDALKLQYQQERFGKSQTWYRPHETATHYAFPINWALWNTILMDGNSFFQCILCGTMWGLNRHQRPAWSTGILIPASFLCGIGAGVLIWRGGVKTKKTAAVEDKLRQALGVDEKVSDTIKRPRRATVGVDSLGATQSFPSPVKNRSGSVSSLSAGKKRKNSASSLPAVPPVGTLSTGFKKDVLNMVDESNEDESLPLDKHDRINQSGEGGRV